MDQSRGVLPLLLPTPGVLGSWPRPCSLPTNKEPMQSVFEAVCAQVEPKDVPRAAAAVSNGALDLTASCTQCVRCAVYVRLQASLCRPRREHIVITVLADRTCEPVVPERRQVPNSEGDPIGGARAGGCGRGAGGRAWPGWLEAPTARQPTEGRPQDRRAWRCRGGSSAQPLRGARQGARGDGRRHWRRGHPERWGCGAASHARREATLPQLPQGGRQASPVQYMQEGGIVLCRLPEGGLASTSEDARRRRRLRSPTGVRSRARARRARRRRPRKRRSWRARRAGPARLLLAVWGRRPPRCCRS